jgi:hypothetical protein
LRFASAGPPLRSTGRRRRQTPRACDFRRLRPRPRELEQPPRAPHRSPTRQLRAPRPRTLRNMFAFTFRPHRAHSLTRSASVVARACGCLAAHFRTRQASQMAQRLSASAAPEVRLRARTARPPLPRETTSALGLLRRLVRSTSARDLPALPSRRGQRPGQRPGGSPKATSMRPRMRACATGSLSGTRPANTQTNKQTTRHFSIAWKEAWRRAASKGSGTEQLAPLGTRRGEPFVTDGPVPQASRGGGAATARAIGPVRLVGRILGGGRVRFVAAPDRPLRPCVPCCLPTELAC